MAGVKQFDQNEVLDRAMMLFWSQGYEATSIDQLVEATGINRGSLYGTFKDKNGIFLAVIDRYLETVAKSLMVTLSDPNPRQAIERMFDSIVGRLSDPKFPRGCLIVNTSGNFLTRRSVYVAKDPALSQGGPEMSTRWPYLGSSTVVCSTGNCSCDCHLQSHAIPAAMRLTRPKEIRLDRPAEWPEATVRPHD